MISHCQLLKTSPTPLYIQNITATAIPGKTAYQQCSLLPATPDVEPFDPFEPLEFPPLLPEEPTSKCQLLLDLRKYQDGKPNDLLDPDALLPPEVEPPVLLPEEEPPDEDPKLPELPELPEEPPDDPPLLLPLDPPLLPPEPPALFPK